MEINSVEREKTAKENLYTLSEFRREAGIPLVLAKKLVMLGELQAIKAVDGTLQIAESEVLKIKKILKNPRNKILLFTKSFGPGFITGASDNDPSTIGTYSSVGAQFGLSILWLAPYFLPLMFAVQEICARIGIVTNKGLAEVVKKNYNKKIIMFLVFFLVIANVVNIGADLGAMAASLKMLTGLNFYAGALLFAVVIIFLEITIQYHNYVKILKWLALTTLAYIITGIIVRPEWRTVFQAAVIPKINFSKEYFFAMAAVFGTTISPYLFFWQASEEVEENKLVKNIPGSKFLHDKIKRMRTDVGVGMILANLVFFFIILTTTQALFNNGITNINSAEEAALSLQPLAGNFAYFLFAVGIIGTGLLAIPVLACSGAYAFAEIMHRHESLELRFSKAKGFYTVIAVSIIIGFLLNLLGINPIRALVYSAFLNGVITIPILSLILMIGDNKKIMGCETNPLWVKFFGWAGVLFASLAVAITAFLYF
jgi:NRAMP (natural resistance-associated macrophage protein)-like metal ion transporter